MGFKIQDDLQNGNIWHVGKLASTLWNLPNFVENGGDRSIWKTGNHRSVKDYDKNLQLSLVFI